MKRPVTDDCRIKKCPYLVWHNFQNKNDPNVTTRRRFCALGNQMPSYLKKCPLEEE